MIKFITGEIEESPPTFSQVKQEQFFVDHNDMLCQKMSSTAYNVLAKHDGTPFSDHVSPAKPETAIKRILPTITKIEF